MSNSRQQLKQKTIEGCSRLLLSAGAVVFLVGDKFLHPMKHEGFLASDESGIIGGILLMLLGAAIALAAKLRTLSKSALQRWSVALLILNAAGAVSYVMLASRGWATPGIPVAGEPFVWAISIMPVCAVFLILNLIWGAFILARRQWRTGLMWLCIIPIWLVAVAIDFAHH